MTASPALPPPSSWIVAGAGPAPLSLNIARSATQLKSAPNANKLTSSTPPTSASSVPRCSSTAWTARRVTSALLVWTTTTPMVRASVRSAPTSSQTARFVWIALIVSPVWTGTTSMQGSSAPRVNRPCPIVWNAHQAIPVFSAPKGSICRTTVLLACPAPIVSLTVWSVLHLRFAPSAKTGQVLPLTRLPATHAGS
jgi:hypothetical protein